MSDDGKKTINEATVIESAIDAAIDEFEESLRRNPHIPLEQIQMLLLGQELGSREKEHFQCCAFCYRRMGLLLEPVAEEELQRMVGADAAAVFLRKGLIRTWIDRIAGTVKPTIESLWEFVSAPLAEGALTFAGERREKFYQRLFEPPIEIELVETESGHLAAVIKTDEPALENIRLRMVLESSQTHLERLLQLCNGAAHPGPSAVVSFGDFEELASKLGLLRNAETGEVGLKVSVGSPGEAASKHGLHSTPLPGGPGVSLRVMLLPSEDAQSSVGSRGWEAKVVDLSVRMRRRIRDAWELDRTRLAAAGSESRGSCPRILHIVPEAWKQSIGRCGDVSVWTARLDRSFYVRLIPRTGDALPLSLGLTRSGMEAGVPADTPDYPLSPVPSPSSMFILPELTQPGTWYLVGLITDDLINVLLGGYGWIIAPGCNRREEASEQTVAAADEICFEAIEAAEAGLWTSFLTALNRVTVEPSPSYRIRARYYLSQLLTSEFLASTRDGYDGDPLLLALLDNRWIGDDLKNQIGRDGRDRESGS
ncbi:MAG: hypothetical protein DIJKHBIC_00829 [Thermoanaerobaculia bacterium]|nr:hypothetical protein [Thermoanaerobaculia bacterium]